jgi:lysophospholipase L1-like esterase
MLLVVACLTGHAQANQDPYYARRATLFDQLPIGKKDIVMLGNSLTDGCEFNELLGNRHIKNRGIVGDIVQGLIDRIGPIIKGQPSKLFIMSGVNDISHDVSADSIARAIEKLIVMVKQGSPRTKIYLQSLSPFNNEVREWKLLKGRDHVVVEANLLLEQVARRQGVTWINLYPLFADENGHLRADLTNDGLHLMGQGYLIWRDAIRPYIK